MLLSADGQTESKEFPDSLVCLEYFRQGPDSEQTLRAMKSMNVLFLMVDQLAPSFLKFGPPEKQ